MDFSKYTIFELLEIKEQLQIEIESVKNRERKKAYRISTEYISKFFSKKENAIKFLLELINEDDEEFHFFSDGNELNAKTVYLDDSEYNRLCNDL